MASSCYRLRQLHIQLALQFHVYTAAELRDILSNDHMVGSATWSAKYISGRYGQSHSVDTSH